jgi:hypothetical protein
MLPIWVPNEDFGRRNKRLSWKDWVEKTELKRLSWKEDVRSFDVLCNGSRPKWRIRPWKRASNIRNSPFVPPSKIFVWEGRFSKHFSWGACGRMSNSTTLALPKHRHHYRESLSLRTTFCHCHPKRRFWKAEQTFQNALLSLPNEDLGRMNKRWNADFRLTLHRYGEQKNGAISHPLLNDGTWIREYSTIRPRYNEKKCVDLAWLLSTHVCKFRR